MVDFPFLPQVGGGLVIPIPPIPPEDFSSLEAINRDIMNSVEHYRTTNQAPRDGDFYAHLGSLGSLGTEYDTAVGQVTRPSPGQSNWRAICTVSALRLEAQIHASRGRFLRELKFYEEAEAEFSTALSVYNALLSGSPVPPRGGNERQLHTFARTINGQIQTALTSKQDIVNEMNVERAEIQTAMMRPDDFITDEMVYRHLSTEEFNRILFDDGNTQTSDSVAEKFESYRGSLDENIRNSVTRSHVAEASFLLELAKRLRVRNMDHAHSVVDRAIEICLRELNAGHGDNEVRLSALLTLAWAYNTKASLMEEKESGTGREFALKSAAIYTFLLFGQSRLSQDADLNRALQNSPELQILFSRYGGDMEVISQSLASVLQGGPIITSGTDILQRNATNELEMYLNLANAMSLARKYDGDFGALTITGLIRKLEGDLDRGVELRDSFFYRVKLADANIQMAYLSRLYGETRDLGLLERFREVETDLQTTLTWFRQKLDGLIRVDADIKLIDQYSLDFFRGFDTLAWVYATLGRIEKNEQGIWNGLGETDYLALAGNYYQAIRLQDNQQVEGDDFASLANRLCRLMRGTDDLSDRLIKMEIETYITWPQVYLHRGELNRELENYDDALLDLGLVTVDDASYFSTQLSIAEIKLVQAQRIFTQSGNLELARQDLLQLLEDPILSLDAGDPTLTSEWIKSQMFKARIHEALGRLIVQTMDRQGADSEFDLALQIYQRLIDNQGIRNTMETEMFITVDQLRLSQAEILKAKGERDINILGEAETEFAALTFDPATLRGMEAEISHFELRALRNKYVITQGLYHDIGVTLTAEDEERLTALIDTLLFQGAGRLAYRALGVLAQLLNQRGKIAELTRGEGRGQEDYLKAAELYSSLVANSILSDNRFLILSGISRGQLMLSQAESLKSAAAQGSEAESSLLYSLHQDADVAYQQALEAFDEINQDPGNQLYYLTSLAGLDAQSGRAENRIAWGRLQEEEEELPEARTSYLQALGFLTPALQHLAERQKVSYLSESRVGLRATTALAWALDSLGEHLEDFTCSSGAESAPAEYRAALLIYSSLVEGELPGEWAVRDRELPPGIEFSGLLGFVSLSRTALLNPQVLYAAETNIWRLRLNYLFALKALKDDATAIYKAEEYIEEAGEPQNLEDKRFLIMALKIVGDVYCWNMEEYDQAEPYYEKAQNFLTEILAGELADRELISLRHQIWMGRAQIYYEREDWELALGLLKQVIEEIKKNEPRPRGDNLLALVNAYLMIGNIYLYELEDENAAQPYFEQLLELAPGNLRIYSNACLGIAAAYLARENYEQARGYYEKVVALDTPDVSSVAIKLNLARARVGLSRILARDGQITEAQGELAQAQSLVEGFSCLRVEKLLDEIEDTGYFWRERREQSVGVGFEAGHSESTFRGRESVGQNYQLTLNVPLTEDLEYSAVLETSTDERGYGERSDSLGRTLPRLYSDTAGSFLNSFLYNQEENNFNLRMRLDLNLNFYGYEVHNYNPQDSLANAVYANAVIQAAAGVDWKLKPAFLPRSTVLLGVDAGGGALAGFNENPATAAQRASLIDQASPELDALTDPNAFLYSWFVQPMARWIFPSFDITDEVRVTNFSIGLGGLFGEDQISTSNEGFWTLGDVDSYKLAFKTSLGLTLAIGDQQRWQIPLEFNAEYGNYTYLQGSLGVGYNFDEALLEFLLWGSYFERQGQEPIEPIQVFEGNNDIQTWDLNLGAAVHF